MMWIYEGRIGGGKTYACVRRALQYLANGGHVAGNLFMDKPNCVKFCRDEYGVVVSESQIQTLEFDELIEFHRHVPQGTPDCPTLVFIDEAQLVFNANDWRKTDNEVLEFLTQSRRASIDVIFVTQHADNLNKQFRRLVSGYLFHRNLKGMKIAGTPLRYPFAHFHQSVFDFDRKTKIEYSLIPHDTRIFGCYQTYGWQRPLPLLAAKGRSTVTKAGKTNLWRHAAAWAVLLSLVGVGCSRAADKELKATSQAVQTMAAAVVAAERRVSNTQFAASSASAAPSLPGRQWEWVSTTVYRDGKWRHVREDGVDIYDGADIPDEGTVLRAEKSGYVLAMDKGVYRHVKIRYRPDPINTAGLKAQAEERSQYAPATNYSYQSASL